ncbi:ABC transporter [Limnochorda pilosa]|uniref:ABC transporter n=1 Tax=Limnochorda pilosa TaxID=1555112 RepID=A0A0K2SGK6_LIMPI|nr:ABC transporter [Limnochorda pilosa]
MDLEIRAADRVLITGPSGGGKTTLARALAGMIPLAFPGEREGRVSVYGRDPARQPLWETAQRLAMVFQRPASQLFNFTVRDEVLFGPLNLGLKPGEAREQARWALEVMGLQGFEERSPRTLSGGELQRLALAAVLAMRPRAVILDEPTAHLDRSGREALVQALTRLNTDDGLSVVVIEHRTRAWVPFARQHLHLAGGRLTAGGPLAAGLSAGTGGGSPRLTLLQPVTSCGRPVLRVVDGVIARRGSMRREERSPVLLRDVNLELHTGELILLTGENGSGKTTLARVLAGFERPARGRVVRSARPLLLFQDPIDQLFAETVEEELFVGLRAGRGREKALPGDLLDGLLRMAGLEQRRGQPVGSLSTGEQRRLALAALVAAGATETQGSLFILDEPTAGQDDLHLQAMLRMIRDLNHDLGAAVLVISHDERLIAGWPGRRLRIQGGRLVEGVQAPKEGA